jgi:pimeloyl-ACP methyl ester carboxylesterase
MSKIVVIVVIILVVFVIASVTVGFIFSNQLLDPNHKRDFSLEVLNVSADSVTLPRTHDTEQRGIFGIGWNDGQDAAIVGDVTSETNDTVTRHIQQMTAPLFDHVMVEFRREVFLNNALRDTLGLRINTIQIPGPPGSLPALYVPGTLDTWAILVHGLNDQLDSGLRFFQPLAKLGMPILEASYRNDLNAPSSPDGLLHLGDSEWHDVDTAVQYALQHGAHHLVLYGWSMGGAIAEEFMRHSHYASSVQALVLDAPVLDWRSTLKLQAENRHLPDVFASLVELIATRRTGINFDNLDQLHQDQGNTPILLFHGTADETTPISVSETFAKEHADIVTFHPVNGADHVQSWNTNPQLYETQVSAFLTSALHLQSQQQ